MSERPSTPRPGPPPGSGAAAGSAQATGSGPFPAPDTSAGHPVGPADGRQGDGAVVVPGPGRLADGRREDGTVVPGPPAPHPQPEEPVGERASTPQAADDGFRGPADTSPSQPLGGRLAPRAGRKPTGDAVVDRALDELDDVSGQPLDRHIEVGQQVHRTLQARLADIGRE